MAISLVDTISQQDLEHFVTSSHSFYQVLQLIGYKQIYDKRTMNRIKEKCKEYNIDYSHLREDRQLEEIVCKQCGQKKLYSDFRENNGKIHHVCNSCKKEYQKNYYANNIVELNKYKEKQKCQKCGETRFYLLDFHHKDPTQKNFGIAKHANTKLSTLMSEIDKCVVLCSNCHREFHYFSNLNDEITLEMYLDT